MDRSYFLLIVFSMFQLVSMGTKSRVFDEDVCSKPPKPEFAKLSCDQKSPEMMECKVKCKRGYVHESGNKVEKFSCNAFHGGWDVYPLPGCHKKCDPPCENKGKCASNNHCICTPEYRGKTCQYEVSLCNPAKLGYDGYDPKCNHTSEKSSCILDCPEGLQFKSPPADIYECSLNGIWTPPSAPGCEPLNVIHVINKSNFPLSNMATEAALSPKSSGVCVAWGRFHYRTFDGRIYSFHGPCTYLLAKDCSEETFSIHISDNPECDQGIPCTRRITIYVGDERYYIEEVDGEIRMTHLEEEVAIPGISGALQLEKVAQYLIVTSSLGFRLKWDGKQSILLSVQDNLKNKTCGLCGQYDGSSSNDFETPSRKVADHVIVFADSWKMPKLGEKCSESLRDDHGCTYKTSDEKAIAEAAHIACYAIYDERYVTCHEILDPEPYFAACKIEFCGCKEQGESCMCDTLAEYFRECVRLGGKVHGGWRRPDVCPLDCPAGMEYEDCGSSCPKTCKETEYECDNEHCVDGCHCPPGLRLHNGECIPETKCPCTHGDQEFLPGEKIPDECNQCECLGSKWECTEKACNARCMSTGDSHYKTFDGYKYQFKGKCSYYLVYHDNFTIIQDNSLCIDSGLSKKSSSCKKSLIVETYSTKTVLKHDMEAAVNGQDINKFPFTNKHIELQKTSSAILLDVINGASLMWDGKSSIYIDAPPSLIGTTQGLCGTFNHNIKDDFSTPDGAIEALIDDFAEKWKTATECKEQIVNIELEDPCEIYKEKEEDAQKLCAILKSEVFKDCHHEEDPDPFYKDCLYDMCACNEETKNCLCSVLANYAAACVKKNVPLPWRQQVKECEIECDVGQTYQECSNPCTYSCKSLSVEKCDKKCVEGCACSKGTTLSYDGVCIPINQCPCFHEEKEFAAGATRATSGLYSCECSNGRWDCNLSNHGKENEMMAYEAQSCDYNKNMVYSECVRCPEKCQNYLSKPKCDSTCRPGCSCIEGYVLNTDTGSCVKRENCGCSHGGKRYPDGSSYRRDCNKCSCLKGKWICEHNECPGICNTWGESHYKTFDGHYFDFQGICEYVLVKGNTSNGIFFEVTIETKICGTSGVTCPKGIKLQLGNGVKLSLSHDEELPKSSYDSPFIVRRVGLFVFVYTRIGVIFQWDRGSHISTHVEPKWKGKLSGLCGNFNDDQADDFKTPAHGPIEARPTFFGDSWKLNVACPFPQDIKDTCAIHSHRKPWAKKRCSVLKSDLFKPCHKFVPLDPYYERCVFDTCGCDLGGDCECFCTALAVYAEECVIHGIAIAWRSQDLCPIQCNEDEKYEPCMSTCPKETCETKFLYNDIKKVCNNEPCVEGCEPKPCPIGQIYNNDRDFKCILEIDCEVPCKEINGRVYVEGERIKDYSVVDRCQTCHCQRGKIICTGDPCLNVTNQYCESTGWSSWMNSPSTSSGDYEYLSSPVLQETYLKFCSPDYITGIQCRTTHSRIPFEQTGQKGVCKLPDGLICNDNEQKRELCYDYEVRIFCQCELSTVSSIVSVATENFEVACVAPGWTHWMYVNVPIHLEGEEFITELRKYYTFCPEEEIEEAECRLSSTKKQYEFERENSKCTKFGMQCNSGIKCPDYEIRFYCRCEQTDCASPRGMENRYIGDSQITTNSVLKRGNTEGYHARLNGPQAWTPKTDSRLEWIQVDLGEIQQVTAIITQGNPNVPQWVKNYLVYYSEDGLVFSHVRDNDGNDVIFEGNSDQDTPVIAFFPYPVRTRHIRIYPNQWHGAISLRLEFLGCIVNVQYITEMPSTTSLPCLPGWTEFINTDSPDVGEGDNEKVEKIVKDYGICFGGKITDIECKALIHGQRVNYKNTGDFGVTCKISKGAFCSNTLQVIKKRCEDYAIRLYCACEEVTVPTTTLPPVIFTTIPKECGWTEWLNIDKPKSFKADAGDLESIEKLQKYYGLCRKPYLKFIECRLALTHHDWKLSLQNELRCDTDVGFVCYNNRQAGDCYDYEVRVYCIYDWCPELSTTPMIPTVSVPITTIMTSTVTPIISTIPITGPCPPGQYYDECAYMCNETCSDYLYRLQLSGKCLVEEDNCIATCRPYKRCEYPFLWKDPYICVKNSECRCVAPNGDYIDAGSTVQEKCEICECYNNNLFCTTAPGCTNIPPTGNRTFTETQLPITTTMQSTTVIPSQTVPQGFCPDEMTLRKFDIRASQITVSSHGLLSGKDRIHIDTVVSNTGEIGAWSPKVSDKNQYVEIDFDSPYYISAIVTQGENGNTNWVTKYSVAYSFDGKLWQDVKEGSKIKIFTGNNDSDTHVTNFFQNMIKTRYIRIIPVKWHKWIAMRLAVIGCLPIGEVTTLGVVLSLTETAPPPKVCTDEMLFPSKSYIPPALITVSSAESEYSGASRMKVYSAGGTDGTGGWKAAVNDNNQFVHIDFQENRNLSALFIQGQEDEDNWVTSFTVKSSIDNVNWKTVKEGTMGQIFRGNDDRNALRLRWFDEIILARYLKIMPITFHGAIAMRLEVLGCYTYEPFGEFSTEMITLPSIAYCPELPETSRENCPYCSTDLVCDGSKCIDIEDCPCYKEGSKYRVGSKYETSDCQECNCRIPGKSFCQQKECLFCPEDKNPLLTTDCQCECRECAEGTKFCPSDKQCIDHYKWCDGNVDCADDEVHCVYTTSSVTFTPTTMGPKMCFPYLNESAATCELTSHYFVTFDGKDYELDVCGHVLFRERHYKMYSVEVHKECEEVKGLCGRYIVIKIDDFIIKIGPGPNRIEFNGIKVPKTKLYILSKRYNEFILRTQGTSLVFISLKYGFEIIWDHQDNVKIKVSACLLNEMNGLCGFYDGIKENDFQKSDGTIAQTVESFTKSWSLGPADHCIQFMCDYRLKLAVERICLSIEDPMFQDCGDVLDMERQGEICVASACECLAKNYTVSDCTCQILESFLQTCREYPKIPIEDTWRVHFSCVPECPPGLEWNDCGSSCELTCDNFQEKKFLCSNECTPGCFCPPGLLRKGDKCIDAVQCHDCVCLGYGDPNYQTFDHQSYAFQGNCTYVLVRHRRNDYHPNFEIYATNTECPEEPGTTCTSGLTVIYNNNVITIVRNQPVKFNQQVLEDIVYNFYQDGINITATEEHVMVYIAENNLLVQYIVPNYGYIIKLPSKIYFNETAGLCGVCNFDARDDLYHRDGYISEDVSDFAYSWLVNGSREMCKLAEVKPFPNGRVCTFEENECDIYIDRTPYIKACENDVSYSKNVNSSMCNTVLQYSSSCCEYGVILDDWIKSIGCEYDCPVGLKFQCKSPCQLTCSNYKADVADCQIPPEYICSCPGDLVMKDGVCVELFSCETCDDEGHKVGEHWNNNLCQSCECLSNFEVVCQKMTCPTPPSCPAGTELQVVGNDVCCDHYECRYEVTTACPSSTIPTCEKGAIPQLKKTYGCPEYECKCDISLCNPLRNITHLEPGEEEIIKKDGCCLEQVIICVTEKCPLQKDCGIGSKEVKSDGKCCTIYDCLPLEKCIYKHRFEGFGNESTPFEENIKLYDVGETWTDGLCTKCRCDKESERFTYSCENEKCFKPSYVTNETDYIYEEQPIPGRCCPEYVRTACRSNGKIYQAGDEWPSSYNDSCASYTCVVGENGEIEKIKNIITCNKNCLANARYIEPSPESLECCGHCEPFACEEDGKIYNVGEKWIPHLKKCVQAECVRQNGRIEKILIGKQCPLIPFDCPDEHKITDESGCCDLCEIIPGACEIKRILPEKSTHYFYLHDIVKGACFNKEPIENLTVCFGRCHSKSMYSIPSELFKTTCNCCTPRDSVIRSITLHCEDNSAIVKQYEEPRSCDCISCSNEEYGRTLKLPTPVK